MSGKNRLEGNNTIVALGLLEVVARTLKKHQVRFALDGGTLLGIVRESRLLPWDNDLDLVALGEDSSKVSAAIDELTLAGFETSKSKFKDSFGPMKQGKLRIAKVRAGEIFADIILKYPDNDHYYWMVSKKMIKKRVERRFYDKFDFINFNGIEYPIPAHIEDYLTARYGDWRTPVQNYNYTKDDGSIVISPSGGV